MAWAEYYEIPYKSAPYEFHLHGLCDLQIGSSSTVIEKIKLWIEEICDDPFDSGVIIPGDLEDEDRPSTRAIRRGAFAGREEVIYADSRKHMAWIDKEVIPLLLPLQKRTKFGIMGVLAGHHWTQITPALNSVQYICQELTRLSGKKVEYLGQMMSFLDLRFKCQDGHNIRKVGHVQHGEGGGQTKSASLNKLDRTFHGFEADFFIRAHDCQVVATKWNRLYSKELKNKQSTPTILSKSAVGLNLGSATRGYEIGKGEPSYVESAMFRPTEMGWGTIKFKFRKARTFEDHDRNVRCDMKVEI